jgi:hypothetical protein
LGRHKSCSPCCKSFHERLQRAPCAPLVDDDEPSRVPVDTFSWNEQPLAEERMHRLGGVPILECLLALMLFASPISMAGWRRKDIATVAVGYAICICMSECMSRWAQPNLCQQGCQY